MMACRVAVLLDSVDLRDIRVIEGRDDLRLALEAGEPFRVFGKRGGQNFDRDLAIEACILCAKDLAHSAGAQRREHLVAPKTSSRGDHMVERL